MKELCTCLAFRCIQLGLFLSQVFDQAFFAAVTLLVGGVDVNGRVFWGKPVPPRHRVSVLGTYDTELLMKGPVDAVRSTFAIGGFVAGMPLIRYTSRLLTAGNRISVTWFALMTMNLFK